MPGTRALSTSEEAAVCAVLPLFSPRDSLLVTLMLHAGYRITETLSLTLEDVWAEGQIRPRVTVQRARLKGGRSQRRKSVSTRSVPLNALAAGALQLYLFGRFGSAGPTDLAEPLFPSRNRGGRLSRWQANRIVHAVLSAAGLDCAGHREYGTHSLRKTFCGRVYRASGNDMALTRMAMGHTSILTTQNYLPVLAEKVDAAILGMSRVPGGIPDALPGGQGQPVVQNGGASMA